MKCFLDAIRLILLSVGIDILEPKKIILKDETSKNKVIYEFNIFDVNQNENENNRSVKVRI